MTLSTRFSILALSALAAVHASGIDAPFCINIGPDLPSAAQDWYHWPMPIPSTEAYDSNTNDKYQQVDQDYFRASEKDPHRNVIVKYLHDDILIDHTFSIPQRDPKTELTPSYVQITFLDKDGENPKGKRTYQMGGGDMKRHCRFPIPRDLSHPRFQVQVFVQPTS